MLYDRDGIYVGEDIHDEEEDSLQHYGTPRHSGRYPWGSGENPYQRNENFLSNYAKLKNAKDENGKPLFTQKQIAAGMGMNTSELRKRVSLSLAENRAYRVTEAKRLKAKGMSNTAIGRRMGLNESTVRNLLNEGVNERMSKTARNAALLKERLDEEPGTYIQVGAGSEVYLNNASSTSLGYTLKMLQNEGYVVENIPVPQAATGKMTTVKVLAKPGTEWKEIVKNKDKIRLPIDIHSEDGGETLRKAEKYVSLDPKRIEINYSETGGADKDGMIELRRGVEDISLGRNHYAQVRILVDNDHYMKGMAVYTDDPLPPGVDIRFNTSKHEGTPAFKRGGAQDSVFKPIKEERENPFGANIKPEEKLTRAQRHYIGEDGNEHLSAINIVKEEGDVDKWNKRLSSQFLSKQPSAMAKQQLKLAYDIAKSNFDEIASYSNPTVKASMLMDFAGRCESDAVHLAAAALPRQRNKFILSLPDNRENEIYAPGFKDGEQVALVRHPHGSITEIPILTVNNQNKKARSIIGDAIDAVGINPKAAERLSGADFDGDTVLVLPMDRVKIRNKPMYPELKGFAGEMHDIYKGYPGMKPMSDHKKGVEMGVVSNLITDMTIQGADDHEIAMALKHSMVIIDAQKHNLDWKRSEIDNHIRELKERYQTGGASTLISRSTSDMYIPERKEKPLSRMTPEEKKRYANGELIYEGAGPGGSTKIRRLPDYPKTMMTKEEKDIIKGGDPEKIKQVHDNMWETGRAQMKNVEVLEKIKKGSYYDPYDLVSKGNREDTTPIEREYADHALAMKELARQARALARKQEDIPRDPAAAKEYADEVASLMAKVSIARKNAPLERQAQLLTDIKMRSILDANPDLKSDVEHYKREKFRWLDYNRRLLGAKKLTVGSKDNPLTDREWEAIMHGAITKTTLRSLLSNCDKGRIKELAMPKTKTGIPAAKLARARSMLKNGYQRSEIAALLDISEGKLNYAMEEGLL